MFVSILMQARSLTLPPRLEWHSQSRCIIITNVIKASSLFSILSIEQRPSFGDFVTVD